jgi:membrane peptidoglycan carboxypeptidase
VALLAGGWLAWEARSLPRADQLRSQLLAHRAPLGQGTWLPLWAIASTVQTAVVAWEDPAFFFHSGLNYREIARAIAINLRAGRYERGASTITQQVVKNLLLSPEKTLRRKVREAILARRLERALTKDEILTVYLNVAEWGDGIVGVEAASRRYFGKSAARLDWSEAALLAGILPNPRKWNPCVNPARARRARQAVLTELLATRQLQPEEFRTADTAPIAPCEPVACCDELD